MFGMGTGVTLAVKPPTNFMELQCWEFASRGVWDVSQSLKFSSSQILKLYKNTGLERSSESCSQLLVEFVVCMRIGTKSFGLAKPLGRLVLLG